uniref:Uncharacterized protein n=1 Tax=Schizaphis graminum TaxID=13262 RepID=A0A2S2NCN8_SCHGA
MLRSAQQPARKKMAALNGTHATKTAEGTKPEYKSLTTRLYYVAVGTTAGTQEDGSVKRHTRDKNGGRHKAVARANGPPVGKRQTRPPAATRSCCDVGCDGRVTTTRVNETAPDGRLAP